MALRSADLGAGALDEDYVPRCKNSACALLLTFARCAGPHVLDRLVLDRHFLVQLNVHAVTQLRALRALL